MSHISRQDQLYADVSASFGSALQRIVRSSETDKELQRDLLQEIHLALWRSLALFDGRSSLSTWVWRVAHNVSASHVGRQKRRGAEAFSLDVIDNVDDGTDITATFENLDAAERLTEAIRQLPLPDRQVIMLYLEGLSAVAIGDVTGILPGTIASRISRFKSRIHSSYKEASNDK